LRRQVRWNRNIDAGERFDWGGFRSPKEKSHGSAVKNKKRLQIPDFHFRRLAAVLTSFIGFAYLFVTSDYVRAHMERHAAAAAPQPQLPQIVSTQ